MRILVTARKRKDARDYAEAKWPRDKERPGTVDRYESGEDAIEISIHGQGLEGRSYDRIYLLDQPKATEGYKTFLMFSLSAHGGRFEPV